MSKKIVVVEAEEEEETAPFWMISFSDLMTLLMAFFVLLYAVSVADQKKMEAMAEGMAARFAMHGNRNSGNKAPAADPNLPKVTNPKDMTGVPELKITPRKQTDTVNGTIVFFSRGSFELNESGKETLKRLSEQLLGSPSLIRVEGHASKTEIGQSEAVAGQDESIDDVERHVDDWAYNRACSVRDYLVSQGLKMSQITLVVIGQYHPLNEAGDGSQSAITETVPSNSGKNSFVRVIQEH
ncbi:flagellar motor protein MotB [Planctomycetales bacterium]|nr:flagellar motor protein MotB [Planctomycetales bacterium]